MQNQKRWTYKRFVQIINIAIIIIIIFIAIINIIITNIIGYFLYYNYSHLLLFSHYY